MCLYLYMIYTEILITGLIQKNLIQIDFCLKTVRTDIRFVTYHSVLDQEIALVIQTLK